jgi:hypothetical protein
MLPENPPHGHSETRPRFLPIEGNWEIGRGTETFTGGEKGKTGIAASSALLPSGNCRVRIRFSAAFKPSANPVATLVGGYRSPGQHFLLAGLGAHSACAIQEFAAGGSGFRPLIQTGTPESLRANQDYLLESANARPGH